MTGAGTDPGLQTLFAQTAKLPLLTSDQEVELAHRRDAGDPKAVGILMEHNLRLAIWRAKRWQNRGLNYEDLIQEAVFGLERAAQKFDPKKGVRFSTYATTWTDHFMQRAISREDIVPYIIRRRRQKADKLLTEGSTVEEIASRLGCSAAEVVEALDSSNVVASLDDESSLHDRLSAPEDGEDETASRVRAAVSALPDDEREFIELRHGLGPHEPHTRTEVARRLGMKASDASALEERAVDALRRLLSDFEYEADLHECIVLDPEDLEVTCER